MKTLDLETTITEFIEIANNFHSKSAITGEQILEKFLSFYREIRIEGALDNDNDMLLLQWGTEKALLKEFPIDMRNLGNNAISLDDFDKVERQYLDFTRQLYFTTTRLDDNGNEVLDDNYTMMTLSTTVYYVEKNGTEPMANMWIDLPEKIDSEVAEYKSNTYVKSLLNSTAIKIQSTVSYV